MKYFIDTEFLEGKQDKRFLGIKYGETKPTIDLISIGIVCEDGKNLYLISKDFNLREAWNRYDLKPDLAFGGYKKVYWIRENVLLPIYKEVISGDMRNRFEFSYSTMKWILKNYGKTNKQIAEEIKEFVYKGSECSNNIELWGEEIKPKFHAFYADYDWVVFCQLFGRMIDLPKGFPMYCIDLKQTLDKKVNYLMNKENQSREFHNMKKYNFNEALDAFKTRNNYPKQTNGHNALADARWNYELYKFLQQL